MNIGCVEEFALSLQALALSVCPGQRHSLRDLLVYAGIVGRVVQVGEAHVAVEHHLLDGKGIFGGAVDASPLVMRFIDGLRSPALENQRLVEVIVEDALVRRVTPRAPETRVFFACLAESMSSSDGCCKPPSSILFLFSIVVNMVNENRFQIRAAFFSVRHHAHRFARLAGSSSRFEFLTEDIFQGTSSEGIVCVELCSSPRHDSFRRNDDEVGEGHHIAIFVVD